MSLQRERHETLRVDLLEGVGPDEPVVDMWFELSLTLGGTGDLYLGGDLGSRGVCPTLRLFVSNAIDPLPDFAALAEHAYLGILPYAFELDSEGPYLQVSMRPVPGSTSAMFEIRGYEAAIVFIAAEVDPRQTALALAHALRTAIENPEYVPHWIEWFMHYGETTPVEHDYFGNTWLRDVVIEEHPNKGQYFDGIDTVNARRLS